MDESIARELRRQKILQNAQSRLDLLKGIKEGSNLNNTITTTEIIEAGDIQRKKGVENEETSPSIPLNDEKSSFLIHRNPSILKSDNNDLKSKINALNNKKAEKIDVDPKCKFNGYSNNEILLFFLLALLMTILIAFDYSNIISHNVLLPFFTLEIAHAVVHFKYIPSTSSQFQMFSILLRLCGISAKSLNNLMAVFNFLFILIDNFIIYIFSFVFINVVFREIIA